MRIIIGRKLKVLIRAFVVLLLVGGLLYSCETDRFFQLNGAYVQENNVLRWAIDFSTMETSDSYVSYWRAGYPEEKFSKISEDKSDHYIEIINLLPNEEYSYRLHG